MTRRKRVLLFTGGSLAAVLLLLLIGIIITVQTSWFAGFARQKIIGAIEDSTGGRVEIQGFEVDLSHLTLRLRECVVHGKEPAGSDPLFRVKLLELRMRLFTTFSKVLDLRYLSVEQPQVNLILLPDGTTNVPQPKHPSPPSQESGLQTVVDLAVGEFHLNDGLIQVLQQKTPINLRGENLRALLNYSELRKSYAGSIVMDPILLRAARQPPLRLHLNLPLTLEKDAIRIADATIGTDHSQLVLSGGLEDMNAPQLSARVKGSVDLTELQGSFDLPVRFNAKGAPRELTLQMAVRMNQKTNALQVENAHVAVGGTTIDAAGEVAPGSSGAIQFTANLALAELSRLMAGSTVSAGGALTAKGRVTLDRGSNYAVDGVLSSRALTVRSGTTEISELSLTSPFHADPFLISLDGLKLTAFGGSLAAKVFVEKLSNLSVEGHLRNVSLPAALSTLTGKQVGYDGFLNGALFAKGNMKAKGTTGYSAQTDLVIEPGRHGIPLEGRLQASYAGSRGALDLGESYLQLPNSRLDLTGSLNQLINVKLTSQNLSDFLPAVNFGSDQPKTSLPVVLQGGTAQLQAKISGNTSAPNVAAHVEVNDFAVEGRSFQRLAADIAASPSGAAVSKGNLVGKGLDTKFDGSIGLLKWAPKPDSAVAANLTLRNGDLADLAALAGESSLGAAGAVTADVHVSGTYGNPTGGVVVDVMNGALYQQPFGRFTAAIKLADQLVTLSRFELAMAGGTITADGDFRHPRESFTAGNVRLQIAANQLQLSELQALAKQNAGVGGTIQLSANLTAEVNDKGNQTTVIPASVTADLSARHLRIQNQEAGDLTATARTRQGNIEYQLNSNFAGSAIKVEGRSSLSKSHYTKVDASIENLSVLKSLQLAGQGTIPARGDFSAKAHVDGTTDSPHATLDFALLNANVYGEPIKSLRGNMRYTDTLLEVSSFDLKIPAGELHASGVYDHPVNKLQAGTLRLTVSSSDIQMGEIKHIQDLEPDLSGVAHLAANVTGRLREEHGKSVLLLSDLNAQASATQLHLQEAPLGGITFSAKTTGSKLNFRLNSDLVKSRIDGAGEAQLTGDYPLRATMSFANIRYSNLAPLLSSVTDGAPPLEALVEGEASINGPALSPDRLVGRLELKRLDVHTDTSASVTNASAIRRVELQNNGPIIVSLNQNVIRIEELHIKARGTTANASGTINLKSPNEPLALHVDANMDLQMLQDADRDFYSSGLITMDASIRGSFAQPRANGQIELKNANVNYTSSPNGLSNANGIILLNGTNATIQTLTGESGGGKLSLSGFVGLGTRTPNFNLQATANRVRVRYSGISATSNATLSLSGNLRRSLLAGTISVERIAYASSSDAGSLLSAASVPPSTPASPSVLLSGMRLAIHVVTAPDIQVVSTYANRFSVIANLTVRGTAENPGMLGRMTVTDGQLVFFGNTYTVTTGTVNFYDPSAIAPVLNLSLETTAQGVDVTIGVAGPMNDLKLSYRSDPPLTFEQIVQLLATNTTPANPVIAAHQPTPPQQSLSQMGESAVLGQAVANPLASRVKRVFGLSQFKIDPSFSGTNGQPSARVTLQQKIASNITFTYITDVTQTNAQIVRIQWDLSNNLSAVGLRDFNGNVSIEMFYKFKRR